VARRHGTIPAIASLGAQFSFWLFIGALPTWPYSAGWGYYPGGGLGLVLLIGVI
jgi:hypothetical protein